MKKLAFIATLLLCSLAASAQVFVGGTIGVSTEKTTDSGRITSFTLAPNFGYNVSDRFAMGLELDYNYLEQGSYSANSITIGPFARYNFVNSGNFSFFGEFGIGYTHYKPSHTSGLNGVSLGVRPGISYKIGNNWQLFGKMNLFNYRYLENKYDDGISTTGFALNFTNIQLGIAYNF